MAKVDQVSALREELSGALTYQIDEMVIYHESEKDFAFREEKVLTVFQIIGNRDVRKLRGTLGETILHQVLLHESKNPKLYRALSRFFIKEYAELILLPYQGSHYYGETCLHITCIHKDVKMFKHLLKCGANPTTPRACGSFFMPYPQKKLRHSLVAEGVMPRAVAENLHDSSIFCYFGEFLLGFAASSGQEELVELCISAGCDINAQDTLGNTVLHIIVLSDNKYKNGCCARMFGLLQKRGADLNIKNDEGLTPLTTAAVLGNLQLFDDVLKMYRDTMWTYGPITCYSYNLCSLDLGSSIRALDDDTTLHHEVEKGDDDMAEASDIDDAVYAIHPDDPAEACAAKPKARGGFRAKSERKRKNSPRRHNVARRICQQICRHCFSVHPPASNDLPDSDDDSSDDEFDDQMGFLTAGSLFRSFRHLSVTPMSDVVALAIYAEESARVTPASPKRIPDSAVINRLFIKQSPQHRQETLSQIRRKVEEECDPELKRELEFHKQAINSREPNSPAHKFGQQTASKKNLRKKKVKFAQQSSADFSSLGLQQNKHHRHRHHSWGRQVAALQVAIHLQHSELLQHPLLKHLLNDKWSAYARLRYHIAVALMFVHVVAVTLAGFAWPTQWAVEHHEIGSMSGAEETSFKTNLLVFQVFSVMAIVGSVYLLLIEIYQMSSQGVVAYFCYYNAIENILTLFHTVNVIAAAILYSAKGFIFFVNIFASIGVVFAWFLFLYKLRGLRHLGALIAMVERILRNDLVTFSPLYVVTTVSFCQAFRVLYYSQNQMNLEFSDPTDMTHKPASTLQVSDGYPEFMTLYKSSMGQAGNWQFEKTASPLYTKFLFVCFSILVTIVSMNLLIAMISFTFNRIYKEAEREWWLQRAEIILGYEGNSAPGWQKWLIKSAGYVRNKVDSKTGIQSFSLIVQEEQDHWGHKKKKTRVHHKWNRVIKRARGISQASGLELKLPDENEDLGIVNIEDTHQIALESRLHRLGPKSVRSRKSLSVRNESDLILEQFPEFPS